MISKLRVPKAALQQGGDKGRVPGTAPVPAVIRDPRMSPCPSRVPAAPPARGSSSHPPRCLQEKWGQKQGEQRGNCEGLGQSNQARGRKILASWEARSGLDGHRRDATAGVAGIP